MRFSSKSAAVRQLRLKLVEILGGRCVDCGGRTCLEFDSLADDAGEHHNFGSLKRMTFYLSLAETGRVQLRCSDCHHRVSRARTEQKRQAALYATQVFGPPPK